MARQQQCSADAAAVAGCSSSGTFCLFDMSHISQQQQQVAAVQQQQQVAAVQQQQQVAAAAVLFCLLDMSSRVCSSRVLCSSPARQLVCCYSCACYAGTYRVMTSGAALYQQACTQLATPPPARGRPVANLLLCLGCMSLLSGNFLRAGRSPCLLVLLGLE